jgi:tol-pal system protein YbgF
MKTNTRAAASLSLLMFVASGCLKTRAQLREGEGQEAGANVMPAQVQPVEPKGEYVIDEIKTEITKLSGRVEDLERNQQHKPEVDAKALEKRIEELENAQAAMLEEMKKFQSQAPAADNPELYTTGKNQFDAGNFEGAIETLSSYLKNPKGKKAEDATWYRAEAYFNTKQYKKAIVDYSKFPEKFTKSKRMPGALHKIGLSFEALGMKEDAKGFYQELVDKFPKSPEAGKAKAKLK